MNFATDSQKIIEDSVFESLHVVRDKIVSLCQTYLNEGIFNSFIVNTNFKKSSNDSEIEIAYKLDEENDYSTIKYTIALVET